MNKLREVFLKPGWIASMWQVGSLGWFSLENITLIQENAAIWIIFLFNRLKVIPDLSYYLYLEFGSNIKFHSATPISTIYFIC